MTKESRQRRENESSKSEEKSRKVRSEQKVRLERVQADKEKKGSRENIFHRQNDGEKSFLQIII